MGDNIVYGRGLLEEASMDPREKMDLANDGLAALKKNLEQEKKEGRQPKSWRRSHWRIERFFRSVIDSNGRKGHPLKLPLMKSIAVFRSFRDMEVVEADRRGRPTKVKVKFEREVERRLDLAEG